MGQRGAVFRGAACDKVTVMKLDKPLWSYKADSSVPAFSCGPLFAVMDAHCALCSRGARWIAHNDRANEFSIIPMQSVTGRALLAHYGLDPDDPASWLYVEGGRAFSSLDAVIRIGRRLGGVWSLLSVFRVLPVAWQDALYRAVARNRYRLFGRSDLCSLPDPEVRKRLLA